MPAHNAHAVYCFKYSLSILPSSAKTQAQAGLSWLYSQLIQPTPPPSARESFFSAPANKVHIVKHCWQPQFKLATQKRAGS